MVPYLRGKGIPVVDDTDVKKSNMEQLEEIEQRLKAQVIFESSA
jgi:hypothetical protein